MRKFIESITGEDSLSFRYKEYNTWFVKKDFNSYYLFFFLDDRRQLIELKENAIDIFSAIKKNAELYQVDMDKNITCIFCLRVSEQEYYEMEQMNQISELSKLICLVEEDLNYFKKNVFLYTQEMEEFVHRNTKSFEQLCKEYITDEGFQAYKKSSKESYEYDFLINLFIKIPFLNFQKYLPKDKDGYQSMSKFIKGKLRDNEIDQEYVDKISNHLETILDDKSKLYAWLDKLVQDKKKSEGELESEN